MTDKLSAARLIRAQNAIVRLWHRREPSLRRWEDAERAISLPLGGVLASASRIALINTFQWHEEDRARDTKASDAVIADVKRNIDRSNQRRVDAIEALDAILERTLRQRADAPLNCETPGSIIDRLSILALKIFHMAEQHTRRDISVQQKHKFSQRLRVLKEQRQDLSLCLDQLLKDISSGKRRFKVYFQLKMYNDPETNPFLRAAR